MVKIREFKLSDLPTVLEIEKASFPRRQAYSRRRFEKYFKECPEEFIVAEDKKEIIGYAIGKLKNKVAEFVSIAVKPDWRKKGAGNELANFLIASFDKKGAKEIFLNVRTKNKIAVSFYRKLGFKILKTVKNYYRNGDNAYMMRKKLGE